jgi:hypothetical protein
MGVWLGAGVADELLDEVLDELLEELLETEPGALNVMLENVHEFLGSSGLLSPSSSSKESGARVHAGPSSDVSVLVLVNVVVVS